MNEALDTVLSEEALLDLLLKDDRKAFDHIFERYWEPLFIYAESLTHDRDEAADIVQEFFINLWKRRQELSIHSSLGAYLFASVKYLILDFLQKHVKKASITSSWDEFQEMTGSLNASQEMELKELTSQVDWALDRLPGRVKEIFQLSRTEQLSSKEIAQRLGLNDQTVRNQISFAIRSMRLMLREFLLWLF